MRYQATKKFKYEGKVYRPGDEWVPEGATWDDSIIETGKLVTPVKDAALERAKKVRYAQKAYRKPTLPGDLMKLLFGAGYLNREQIEAATDEELLAINGIGKARLKQIRGEYGNPG